MSAGTDRLPGFRMPGRPLAERFWPRVDRSGGQDACWPWLAGVGKHGYGKFAHGPRGAQKHYRAHVLALLLTTGSQDGVAMHSCDNPPCCNPRHLSWGTHAQNRADCVAKGRQAKGSTSGLSKLTESDVIDIRSLVAFGARYTDMAQSYGVRRSQVSAIVTRRAWRHVP